MLALGCTDSEEYALKVFEGGRGCLEIELYLRCFGGLYSVKAVEAIAVVAVVLEDVVSK